MKPPAFALFRSQSGRRGAPYFGGTLPQIHVDDDYCGAPACMAKPHAGMFAVFASASK